MDDQRDPHYTPFGKSPPARPRDPGEALWTFRREGIKWSCVLVFRGESYRWEARVLKSRELSISRRFILREPSIYWALEQRADIERGWIEG
jgi:hypothetical protein